MIRCANDWALMPLLAVPVFGTTALAVHLGLGVPFTFSAITTYEWIAGELTLCFLAGLIAYMIAQTLLLRRVKKDYRSSARRFHLTCAAILTIALTPMFWLINGFALDAPLPSAQLMFLPLFTGYIGCLFTAVAALAWCLPLRRQPTHD